MSSARHILILLVLFGIGAVLTVTVAQMPSFGDRDAPAHRHVVPRYIADTFEETGVPSMVAAILADYRGYDTLGELTVIFTAGSAVLSLLVGGKHE